MKTNTLINPQGFKIYIIVYLTILFLSSCAKESTNRASTSENSSGLSSISDLQTGLVAWYTFNGNTLDSSGHGNHVIFNNATPVKDRFGNPKGAYRFNGIDNYMRVANSTSLNPTTKSTLFAIVKVLGFYQGECHSNKILSKGDDDLGNGVYQLGFDDARFYNFDQCGKPVREKKENFFGFYGDKPGTQSNAFADDTAFLARGIWYTIAFTYNGQVAKFYLNGILRRSDTTSATFTPNTNDLFFGKLNKGGSPYWLNGIIDEIRIYNRALTAKQIRNLSQ